MNTNIHKEIENTYYKDFKLKQFREYLYKKIKDSDLSRSDKEDKKSEIQDLIMKYGGDNFAGKMFYITLKNLDGDIDQACESLFHDYVYPGITPSTKLSSKFAIFVSGICLNDGDIASAIGSSGSRISRVRNNTHDTDFYPFQVYALAKISGILPSQLFEYFYGNGERPIIGLVLPPEEEKEEK